MTTLSTIAQQLGKRGGDQTKKRGSAYCRTIGRKGLQKRWAKRRRSAPGCTTILPSQRRFNCRRRNLMLAYNLIRRAILGVLDVAQDATCVSDSLPIPVISFPVVPQSHGD